MVLYRIAKCNFVDDLSGTGARLYGGRWNSVGKSMVYLSSSRSLAVLEVLVHLSPVVLPNNFCIAEIEVPDNDMCELDTDLLPENWNDISPPVELKKLGDKFLEDQECLLLKVPSAIVSEEYNYLFNPLHADAKKVKVLRKLPFNFDERLIES